MRIADDATAHRGKSKRIVRASIIGAGVPSSRAGTLERILLLPTRNVPDRVHLALGPMPPFNLYVPDRVHFALMSGFRAPMFPIGNMVLVMDENDNIISQKASELASAFGSLIRNRRQALAMTQDQLALATGVGRRFLIDLEAGKTSCQIGRSLVVAEALGLRPADILNAGISSQPTTLPDLPDLIDEEKPNG